MEIIRKIIRYITQSKTIFDDDEYKKNITVGCRGILGNYRR